MIRLNADAIRAYVRRHNMTFGELAEKAGISRPWLSTLMSGTAEPGKDARIKLQGATGLSWDELFTEGGREKVAASR